MTPTPLQIQAALDDENLMALDPENENTIRAVLQDALVDKKRKCKYGDDLCPCQDGDMCQYEGPNPMTPPGMVLVPVEPTDEMRLTAACQFIDHARSKISEDKDFEFPFSFRGDDVDGIYKAMIAARPQPGEK